MTRGPTILAARFRSLVVGGALVIGSAAGLVPAPAAAAGESTWHVQAGNVDSFTAPSQENTAFYPARTVVHENDQVVFSGVGAHTVTFNLVRIPGFPTFVSHLFGSGGDTLSAANQDGGAELNSGAFGSEGGGPGGGGPPPPANFTLHIGSGTAGSQGRIYHFLCAFHRDMAGTITVLPASVKLPSTDAKNQKLAARFMEADIRLGNHLASRTAKDDERVAAGIGTASVQGLGSVSVLRFLPGTIEIEAGSSVTFTNQDINVPHTVTFGVELPGPPEAPPGLIPYGGNVVSSPDQQVNSGFLISQELIDYLNVGGLLPPPPIFTVTRTATFTFPNAGTYHYICALHDELGMQGDVVVRSED